MQSESGTVRARGRKVLTENHFRAAELNSRSAAFANPGGAGRYGAVMKSTMKRKVSSDGYSPVIGNAYDSMLY